MWPNKFTFSAQQFKTQVSAQRQNHTAPNARALYANKINISDI